MTSSDQNNDDVIRRLLKRWRGNISPAQAGLPVNPKQRRRVPGLRREEVAALVGISSDWYTRIEQGRVPCSLQVVDRLAHIFQISYLEKAHLLTLMGLAPALARDTKNLVSPALQRVLDHQHEKPAYILNQRWDTVAWNQSACAIFCDFEHMTMEEGNVLNLLFTNPKVHQRGHGTTLHIREILPDWATHARMILCRFRSDYAQNKNDSSFDHLIQKLSRQSPEFNEWWTEPDVDHHPHREKGIYHPYVGTLSLQQMVFQPIDDPCLQLILYTPVDNAMSGKLIQIDKNFTQRE